MDTATELIKELQGLVLSECYPEALARLKETVGIVESSSRSNHRKVLLLLASKIYIGNNLVQEAETCLNVLSKEIPGSVNDFEYIIRKVQIFLLRSDYDNCSNFIIGCKKNNWTDNQEFWLRHYLGRILFWKGDYFGSNRLFEECRDNALSSGDECLEGYSLFMMGYIALQRCFFEIADVNFIRALECFQRCNKKLSQGRTHKIMAILAYRTGKYEKAENILSTAIKLFESTGFKRSLINSNIALGRVQIFKGQYKQAETILLDTREKSLEAGFKRETALSSEFLGELCYHKGRYEESLAYLKEAERFACEIAPEGDVAVEVYRRLSDLYLALGEIDEAENTLSKAHKLCERLNDKYELGSVLRIYGKIAARKNDIDLARSFFNESIVTLRLIQETFELAGTYMAASRIYGDWAASASVADKTREELAKEARYHALEGVHLYSSLGLTERAGECRELFEKIESRIGSVEKEYDFVHVKCSDEWRYADHLIARSSSMIDVIEQIRRVAPSGLSVLVSGETGTGKEIVAELIHKLSDRSSGPFIAINCASVPSTVFESEFFGHKKGSFTGAYEDKAGFIEQASGGTLFLDEISDLSSQHQAKLLRVLQDERVRRIGDFRERPVDIRVVSASNRNIDEMISSGDLRTDFFYRVGAEQIYLEPLRNRREDIEAIFMYYMGREDGFLVEKGVLEFLREYHWPGNVRELVNVVNSMKLLVAGKRPVKISDLPLRIRDFSGSEMMTDGGGIVESASARCEKLKHAGKDDFDEWGKMIDASIRQYGGNRSAAARQLGISRSTLYRRIKELENR